MPHRSARWSPIDSKRNRWPLFHLGALWMPTVIDGDYIGFFFLNSRVMEEGLRPRDIHTSAIHELVFHKRKNEVKKNNFKMKNNNDKRVEEESRIFTRRGLAARPAEWEWLPVKLSCHYHGNAQRRIMNQPAMPYKWVLLHDSEEALFPTPQLFLFPSFYLFSVL